MSVVDVDGPGVEILRKVVRGVRSASVKNNRKLIEKNRPRNDRKTIIENSSANPQRSLRAKPLNMAEPLIDITSEIEAACAVLDQGEVSHRAAALGACYQWL